LNRAGFGRKTVFYRQVLSFREIALMPDLARLKRNVEALENRIAGACASLCRRRNELTLIAITKTVTPEFAAMLPELGVFDLGESRPQELWRKQAALPASVRWHLVGHLQRNKVERTLPIVQLIHSVDSLRLLETIEREAGRFERPTDVLLEFNLSREHQKHGFEMAQFSSLAQCIPNLRWACIRGLMTMAALSDDPEHARPVFAELRNLRDRLQREIGPAPELHQLSMGMSQDFEVAIEEGATLIRVGTALFEGLEP
jgi:hypothetical protein